MNAEERYERSRQEAYRAWCDYAALHYDSDNRSKSERIIDAIIDAAVAKAQQGDGEPVLLSDWQQQEQRIKELEAALMRSGEEVLDQSAEREQAESRIKELEAQLAKAQQDGMLAGLDVDYHARGRCVVVPDGEPVPSEQARIAELEAELAERDADAEMRETIRGYQQLISGMMFWGEVSWYCFHCNWRGEWADTDHWVRMSKDSPPKFIRRCPECHSDLVPEVTDNQTVEPQDKHEERAGRVAELEGQLAACKRERDDAYERMANQNAVILRLRDDAELGAAVKAMPAYAQLKRTSIGNIWIYYAGDPDRAGTMVYSDNDPLSALRAGGITEEEENND